MNREEITAQLLGMIGQPFKKPDGCLPFLKDALALLGIEIEGTVESRVRDGTKFNRVDRPEDPLDVRLRQGDFGDVILWERVVLGDNPEDQYKFHLGLMLDKRYAIQSSLDTNGVGKVEITRDPWRMFFRAFYRPKIFS